MFFACTARGPQDAVLRAHLSAEPVSLDPALAEDGVSLRVLANVMEGLVGYDGAGELQQHLAESVEVSDGGKAYRFKLRPQAKWSDGQPVRASEFVAAIRRALTPSTGSKLASMLYPIRGARAFHEGKGSAEQVGVLAESQARLLIMLERPTSYFLHVLTLPVAMPLREGSLKDGKWDSSAPVTGPYVLTEHKADQSLLLKPNPHYWNPGSDARSSRVPVLLRIVGDESTASHLFEGGDLDILARVPAFDFKRYKEKGVLRVDPMFATYFLGFNLRKSPFQDRDLRRAVAGAIRREEITAALASGERPARSWIPYGLEGHIEYQDPVPVFAESMARVKALMEKQERQGKSVESVVAGFDGSGRNSMIMEKVQEDLRTGLDLVISLTHMDWKSYVRGLRQDAPPIFRFGWLAPFRDPISHLQSMTSKDPNNHTGWSHAKYDRLVEEISAMPSGPAREEKIRHAQRILVDEEAVLIPLYHYVQTHAVSPKVEGFRVNPFGVIRFEELRIRK